MPTKFTQKKFALFCTLLIVFDTILFPTGLIAMPLPTPLPKVKSSQVKRKPRPVIAPKVRVENLAPREKIVPFENPHITGKVFVQSTFAAGISGLGTFLAAATLIAALPPAAPLLGILGGPNAAIILGLVGGALGGGQTAFSLHEANKEKITELSSKLRNGDISPNAYYDAMRRKNVSRKQIKAGISENACRLRNPPYWDRQMAEYAGQGLAIDPNRSEEGKNSHCYAEISTPVSDSEDN